MQIIITGGHSGIGLELTKLLLKDKHRIGLILRSEKRKTDTLKILGNPENLDFFFADLSNQNAVLKVAKAIKDRWNYVDGLFNNAGVLMDQAYYSEHGNEMHFEVNTLAAYSLSLHLKPAFAAAKVGKPFIVNTVTGGLHKYDQLDIDHLKQPEKFVKLTGSYMQSKLALALMMNHLAKDWTDVRIVNVDPGPNKTKMTSGPGMPKWLLVVRNLLFPKPIKGAKKLYAGAFDSTYASQSGIYLSWDKLTPIQYELSLGEVNQIKEAIKLPVGE